MLSCSSRQNVSGHASSMKLSCQAFWESNVLQKQGLVVPEQSQSAFFYGSMQLKFLSVYCCWISEWVAVSYVVEQAWFSFISFSLNRQRIKHPLAEPGCILSQQMKRCWKEEDPCANLCNLILQLSELPLKYLHVCNNFMHHLHLHFGLRSLPLCSEAGAVAVGFAAMAPDQQE